MAIRSLDVAAHEALDKELLELAKILSQSKPHGTCGDKIESILDGEQGEKLSGKNWRAILNRDEDAPCGGIPFGKFAEHSGKLSKIGERLNSVFGKMAQLTETTSFSATKKAELRNKLEQSLSDYLELRGIMVPSVSTPMATQSPPAPKWATRYWTAVKDFHIHAHHARFAAKQFFPSHYSPRPSIADFAVAFREVKENIAREIDGGGEGPIPMTTPERLPFVCRIVRDDLSDVARWQDAIAAEHLDVRRQGAWYDLRPLCRELWTLLQRMPGDGPKPRMPGETFAAGAGELIHHVDAIIEW